MTFGSIIECWFSDTMTSSISLSIRCNCGFMWKVSAIMKKKHLENVYIFLNDCYLFGEILNITHPDYFDNLLQWRLSSSFLDKASSAMCVCCARTARPWTFQHPDVPLPSAWKSWRSRSMRSWRKKWIIFIYHLTRYFRLSRPTLEEYWWNLPKFTLSHISHCKTFPLGWRNLVPFQATPGPGTYIFATGTQRIPQLHQLNCLAPKSLHLTT